MKVKCYEITPHPDSSYDILIIPAGETWKPILENIEWVLEELYIKQDDPKNADWDKIEVKIRCIWYEEEDLYDIGYSPEQINKKEKS